MKTFLLLFLVVLPCLAQTPTVTVQDVPDQLERVPFQVVVTVLDARGQPLPGVNVSVSVDPAWRHRQILLWHGDTVLADGTGRPQPSVEGVTDASGRALLWVRLSNELCPFHSVLVPQARWEGQVLTGTPSQEFTVDLTSDYNE